ncbi:MAG: adenine deaminase [Eubacteriales bacterium]|nr:adenine deaminase [Eubacteriales bacterium]
MVKESYEEKISRKLAKKQSVIEAASGRKKADLVLKNATFVNVFSDELQTADIAVCEGLIVGIGKYDGEKEMDMTGKIVCPGFIDAHIHLESSLAKPAEFVKAVLPHGTTAVVTDPHEIANVMGTDGIEYMLESTEGLPVDTYFMLPSCVPATPMDESGANLSYRDIDEYFEHPRVLGLAEMMNSYGVIAGDGAVVSKIIASQAHHKKIDGHAPFLKDNDLNAYISAGVYSDHECSDINDAMEKLRRGQFIMIREGTAARNLEALYPLLVPQFASRCMFCTDDKHPSDLLSLGHIDYIVKRAINEFNVDPIIAVKAAGHQAAKYFLLNNRGAIAPGYLADFAIIDDFKNFNVLTVIKKGKVMFNSGKLEKFAEPTVNAELDRAAHDTMKVKTLSETDFEEERQRGLIGMINGEIVTTDNGYADKIDVTKDILKIAVVERHKNTGHIGIGYIQGYGLKSGAVATSISHDSHNIIVVGANEKDMAFAVNEVAKAHGGIVVANGGNTLAKLELPIAGIMSDEPLETINEKLETAKQKAYEIGVNKGIDPFMTLSFMALPVIPKLRLTTRGVIDVEKQKYV